MPRSFVVCVSAVLLTAISLPAALAGHVRIEFDYSLDTDNFFDSSTPVGLERRAVLELAASLYDFDDRLTAIQPGGGQTWSADVFHPSQFGRVTITDRAVPADTIVIYAGGRSIPVAGVLGFANATTNVTVNGSAAFADAVLTRGQPGAAAPEPTDFAPALGSITFFHSPAFQWHFGATTAGLNSTKSDFLTTAVHEIGHLLGMGEAESWFRWIEEVDDQLWFHGPQAIAAHGGPVPLDSLGAHFGSGLTSTVDGILQGLLMDPSTPRGVRELPTALDLAAFGDIGWIVVPEPGSLVLGLLAAVSLFGVATRHKSG